MNTTTAPHPHSTTAPDLQSSDGTDRTAGSATVRPMLSRIVASVALAAFVITAAMTGTSGTAGAAVSAGSTNYADTYMYCYYSIGHGGVPNNYVVVAALDLRGFDSARIWRYDRATNSGRWTTGWVPASRLHNHGQVPRIGGSAFYVQYHDAQTGAVRGEWARRLDNGSLSTYCG